MLLGYTVRTVRIDLTRANDKDVVLITVLPGLCYSQHWLTEPWSQVTEQ